MKILTILISALFSSLVYANDNASVIDMHIKAKPLSEAVELLNSKCLGEVEPVVVENPSALISLNFKQMPCETAALIVQDFDKKKKAT